MGFFPPIEPHARGMLDVGDGHRLYWEVSGNPDGVPAVVLHGGPGSGCSGRERRYFDPSAYRIVLFDQRGAGRSTPHASEPDADLSTNTTPHLVADIERLREHLGIEQWLVLGGSWGATLALAYAQLFAPRVSAIVLVAVTTTRRSEIDWLYRGLRSFFPEEWERFRDGVPASDRDSDLVAAYHRLLLHPDAAVRARAAADFHDWEWVSLAPRPSAPPGGGWLDPRRQLGRARIVTHYFPHGAWLDDGQLIRDARALAGIPGVLVHGRRDIGSPLATAWELARAWPDAELVIVEEAGHSPGDAGMDAAIVAATSRLSSVGEIHDVRRDYHR